MTKDDTKDQKRRTILKKTGAAVAAGAILPGAANAKPGNGNGHGKGNGHGHDHGGGPGKDPGTEGESEDDGHPGEGQGPDENGPGGGPPFKQPDTQNVVFCGCSQVCICQAQCCSAYVFVEGGDNIAIDGEVPTCVEVEEGRIVAVADTGIGDDGNPAFQDEPYLYCNPNTACGRFDELTWPNGGDDSLMLDRNDCNAYGTAPQFGARCGDAFLSGCPDCDSTGPELS